MKALRSIALAFVWVYAILATLATTLYGADIVLWSWEGLKYTYYWAVSWFQAGGNMMPNFVFKEYLDSWSTEKAGK